MAASSSGRLSGVWLLLLGLTGAAVAVVNAVGGMAGLLLVLSLALVKARFVIADFMGLRGHVAMRRALTIWCLAPAISAILKVVAGAQ